MNYFVNKICRIILVSILLFAYPSLSKEHVAKVAAIVGTDVITTFDLEERMALSISSSGLEGREEVIQELLPQVIKLLIDEKLQEQEAEKLNISVSEEEVIESFNKLEQRNNLPFGELAVVLKKQGTTAEALKKQLRAQLLWQKIVMRKIRPKVKVTDQDVKESIDYISSQKGNTEVDLQEIVLPVDSPEDEDEVIKLASKLLQELRGGADFSAIAKEFSRSFSAVDGGSIGWTKLEQLSRKLVANIRNLEPGNISNSIKVGDRYYIVKLKDRRYVAPLDGYNDVEISMRQALIPFENEEVFKPILERVNKEREKVKSCDEFEYFASASGSSVSSDLVTSTIGALNKKVRSVVEDLDIGVVSPAVKSDGGIHVFIVCDKEKSENILNKDKIKDELFRQRMDLLTRQYIRNLRRNTYFEIRL